MLLTVAPTPQLAAGGAAVALLLKSSTTAIGSHATVAERARLIPRLGLQLECSDAESVFFPTCDLDTLLINEAFEHCRVATYLALRLRNGSYVVVFNRTRPRFRSLAVAYRALSSLIAR